jgi:ribosomal-protein-alanine N-acetyltransferase
VTPEDFAGIMERAYVEMRPWPAQEVARTLQNPQVHFLTRDQAGIIAQIVADECEILALATDPAAQRRGVATLLLTELVSLANTKGARRIFLEVARNNERARAFYAAKGFAQVGTRPDYYTLRDGTHDDAVLLSHAIGAASREDAPT